MRFSVPIKENRTNEGICPYCLGLKKVSMFRAIIILGKYRLVKEIEEPCVYCNLINIGKSEFKFQRKKTN